MKIINLNLRELKIPFKHSFSHAAATRNMTEAVIVQASSASGHKGYGEGCPRSYVTGETISTVSSFFERHKASIYLIANLDDLTQWVDTHELQIDKNPAAWCAIELALLDLLARQESVPIEKLLKQPILANEFQYTAILGTNKHATFVKQLEQYSQLGFSDFKLKVTGDLEQDKLKIEALRALTNVSTVRLDANNLWPMADEAVAYIKALDYDFLAIEEPLGVNDYEGCLSIHNALNIPIILDESFLRQEQFKKILEHQGAWILNIRVSKMGGLLRSLKIAEYAKENIIPIIIGAQVGETSILTRAALTIANAYKPEIIGQEGAFGAYLLEKDIVSEPLMFAKAGKLKVTNVSKSDGLGLVVNVSL